MAKFLLILGIAGVGGAAFHSGQILAGLIAMLFAGIMLLGEINKQEKGGEERA